MAYKRRFSDDDVELMEQDADAAGRITAAERKMALSGNSFNNRNNEIADLTAAAHERRMASRARFIEGNPNSVSPQERAAVMQWQHNQGLTGRESAIQDFERGMARDRIKGDVAVTRQKLLGMENQGLGVGKLKHGYTDENGNYHEGSDERIAREQGKNALSLAEKEWAKKKEIAELDAKSRQLGIEAEHGSYDENGNYRPGSRVLSERERGEWGVKHQTEANKGTLAQAEVKRQQQEAQERARKEKLTLEYAKLDEKTKKDIDAQATALSRDKQISFDEAKTQIMATREQLQQQGGKKEIKRQRNSQTGEIRIVYDDGSTEIVKG